MYSHTTAQAALHPRYYLAVLEVGALFGCGTALLGIHVLLRLSYTGHGLARSHGPSSGKQPASGQQEASVVCRLTEGLFVTRWAGFFQRQLVCWVLNALLDCLVESVQTQVFDILQNGFRRVFTRVAH